MGYPFRNDFTSLLFNFRNGDGIGNEKLFPVSLPPSHHGWILNSFIHSFIHIGDTSDLRGGGKGKGEE